MGGGWSTNAIYVRERERESDPSPCPGERERETTTTTVAGSEIQGEELRLVRLDLKDHPGHPRLMYYLGVLLDVAQGILSLAVACYS